MFNIIHLWVMKSTPNAGRKWNNKMWLAIKLTFTAKGNMQRPQAAEDRQRRQAEVAAAAVSDES